MIRGIVKYLVFALVFLGFISAQGQELNQRYYYNGPLWQDFRKVLPYTDTSFFVATQSWAPANFSNYQTQVGIINKKGDLLANSTSVTNIISNYMSIGDINYASDNELIIGGSILGNNMILKLNDGNIDWSYAFSISPLNLTLNTYFDEVSPDNFIVGGYRIEGDYAFLLEINSAGEADSIVKFNASDSLSSIKSMKVYPANSSGYYVILNQDRTDLLTFWDSYFNIIKLNDTLGVEWNRSYYLESESDFSEVYDFLETDNSLVVTGRHNDAITFLEFDKSGNPGIAKKIIEGSDEQLGWGACLVPNNEGGFIIGTGVPSPTSTVNYQSILLDVENDGSINWAKRYNPEKNASFANLLWVEDTLIATGRVVANEANLGFWLTTQKGYEDCSYNLITEDLSSVNTIIQNHDLPVVMSTFPPFQASSALLSTRSDTAPQDSLCTYTSDVVFPGDANFDQTANIYDLLPIGIFYNSNGTERPNASTDWNGQWSANWGTLQIDGADIKHVDANGDGIINASDADVINDNYAKTHTSTLRMSSGLSPADGPEIYIEFPENVPEAIEFTSEVIFGTEDNPTEDVYGICFVLDYSISPAAIAEISFEPDPNWLGAPDSVLFISKHLEEAQRLEIGMVKTTGMNERQAFGPIGTVYIVTEDNILGRPISNEVIIEITDIKVVSNDETILPVSTRENQTVVTGLRDELINNQFAIYPNPTTDKIQILNSNVSNPVDGISIYNSKGDLVLDSKGTKEISMAIFPTGLYWIKVSTKNGIGYYKLLKQ